MNIRAVFFDMGGTIETLGTSDELRLRSTAALDQLLKEAGIDLNLSNEDLLKVVTRGIKSYRELCLETMIEYSPQKVWSEFIFKDFEVDPLKLAVIAEELAVFVENNFYFRGMRPEVPGVLDAIQKMGLRMGVISNVNSHTQVHANLEKYGIISYFDPIVLSSDYGIRKPDPSIFHYAARLMNAPTSSCVYIGDRISRDILGSQKAGFKISVQIRDDFDHGETDDGAVPDAVIDDMTGLIPILQHEMLKPPVLPPTRIKALLFDAGDVLYYRPRQKNGFTAFLQQHGIYDAEKHLPEKRILMKQAFKGQIDMDEFYGAYLNLLGITEPQLIEKGKAALIDDNSHLQFFPGVKETLLELKARGYFLAIITDTANSVKTKLQWFENGGFGHIWDAFISSKEVGLHKPDPGMYLAALNQLQISPQHAAFIGHDKDELAGAKAVGMNTIAFNYDESATADHFIKNFSDLLDAPSFFDL